MADPGAVVHVVREEPDSGDFLHDVAFLVRRAAGDLEPEGLRPVLIGGLPEFLCHQVEGFIPACLHEFAVLLDEGLREAVRAVHEFVACHALRAELPLVDRAAAIGLYTNQLSIVHHQVQSASDSAIRAGGLHVFHLR